MEFNLVNDLEQVAQFLVVSGSFAYYACACACPRVFAWLSVRGVGARVLSSLSPPSSPYSGE